MVNSGQTLILASASPRRQALLKQIGIVPDQILPADIDETQNKNETVTAYVRRLAWQKANHLADNSSSFIIGADTTVAVGTRILGKPDDEQIARKYLSLMSGRRHRVHTGVCVIAPEKDGPAPSRNSRCRHCGAIQAPDRP